MTTEFHVTLSESELKEILETASKLGAEKAIEELQSRFVMSVGRSVLDKLVYFLGIGVIATLLWANSHGLIKLMG